MLQPGVAYAAIAIETAAHGWTMAATRSMTGGEHSSMEGSRMTLFPNLPPCRAPDSGNAVERRLHQVNPCAETNP
jgi:hypothetical protein